MSPILTVADPEGKQQSSRMPLAAYLQMVAATSFKQRIRKMIAYYHADRLHYVVAGTPNRLEYDQGFFVKLGDGVRRLQANRPPLQDPGLRAGRVPRRARITSGAGRRRPTRSPSRRRRRSSTSRCRTTRWTSASGHNHGVPPVEVGAADGLTAEQVERVYKDIDQKRRTTRYLHARPLLVEPVEEVHA